MVVSTSQTTIYHERVRWCQALFWRENRQIVAWPLGTGAIYCGAFREDVRFGRPLAPLADFWAFLPAGFMSLSYSFA